MAELYYPTVELDPLLQHTKLAYEIGSTKPYLHFALVGLQDARSRNSCYGHLSSTILAGCVVSELLECQDIIKL